MSVHRYIKYLLLNLLFFTWNTVQAQIPVTTPQPVSPKAVKRYEIDAKRLGVAVTSEDALPRSREFLRIDSTYYVGWLYEGAYKMNHAADYLGYKNASVPLAHALRLMDRDFHKELSTHSGDLATFYPAFRYQVDYTMTAYFLLQCYMNMEAPEEANALLRRVLRWNFQRDLYLDVYNYLAWNVHRNRFYTSSKYAFLKNSIDENEALANRYLDSGLRRIDRNQAINAHIFPPGYEKPDKLAVYHYKCILYSYNFNIDSAMYYFNQMRNTSVFPHNNYATFRMICGDFRDAEKEYNEASAQESGDKRLREYIYYAAILDLYKGEPKAAVELLKEMIKANGSTPGFGWYNIGLARAMLYDGQIDQSKKYIEKAATFKELHIGTTLGQSHYDFSVQLNKLMNKEAEFEMQRFEHANWWYNPSVIGNMAQLTVEKYLQQFLIINQFAQNPERDRVIYKLFSTESTVTWDEIWYLIRDFSSRFFLEKFQKTESADNRKYIRKYFQLFIARLYMKQGDYTKARQLLDALLRQPDTDLDYEKLYIARAFEAEAACARELKNDAAAQDYLYRMYQLYPQLVPFCGQKINMSLKVTGNTGKDDNTVVSKLKACNIGWTENAGAAIPEAVVSFEQKGKTRVISYYVTGSDGKLIVPHRSFSWQKADDAGRQLAYCLFGVGGEQPSADTQ